MSETSLNPGLPLVLTVPELASPSLASAGIKPMR